MGKIIKFSLIIIVILFPISCKKESLIKKKKYPNGSLKEKIIYKNSKDSTTFTYYSYFKNGKIKKKYNKKEGLLEGEKVEYYKTGTLKYVIPFEKGKANGIVKHYYPNGKLRIMNTFSDDINNGVYKYFGNNDLNIVQKALYIDDKAIIRVDKGEIKENGKNYYGISYFYYSYKDSTFLPVGSLTYKNINQQEKIQKSCTYFETIACDTINYGEVYKITIISNLGLIESHRLTFKLGKINKNYEFVDNSNIKTIKSNSNRMDITLLKNDYNKGINLVTGKLRIFNEGIDVTNQYMMYPIEKEIPYIFFKQFYVK